MAESPSPKRGRHAASAHEDAAPAAEPEWSLDREFTFHDGRAVRWTRLGAGPPVVLVHGTPWSSFVLRHLARGLAADHTVYAYDLLGYGQSSKAEGNVSLGVQNGLLKALLDHWGLEAPAVVAHDFGGATALRAHILDGAAYGKLVLIDPVAVSPWGSPFFNHVREHEAAFAGVPDFIHEAVVRAYVQTAAHRPLTEEVLEGILKPWRGAEGRPAFYRQIAQASSWYTDEVQPRYGGVAPAVLLLWGAEDTWIPLAKGRELAGLIGDRARLVVVEDAGHLVVEEEPDQLLREIRKFLAEGRGST